MLLFSCLKTKIKKKYNKINKSICLKAKAYSRNELFGFVTHQNTKKVAIMKTNMKKTQSVASTHPGVHPGWSVCVCVEDNELGCWKIETAPHTSTLTGLVKGFYISVIMGMSDSPGKGDTTITWCWWGDFFNLRVIFLPNDQNYPNFVLVKKSECQMMVPGSPHTYIRKGSGLI